ncbi:hypothetical protein LT493_17780 [Streptomyces tricolor]|nr:hypothetical protein [Streptomyces tricolor]
MPTAAVPLRLLDPDSAAQLTSAAHTLLAPFDGDPTHPRPARPRPRGSRRVE